MPKKLPIWSRIILYYFNCVWYYVLFPLGAEEDEFTKQWREKKLFSFANTDQKKSFLKDIRIDNWQGINFML